MKFKKHISLFLAFFLLVSNTGLAFNVHYCGDEIDSISLQSTYSEDNNVDICCGVIEKNSQCCKDKIVQFQKKSDLAIVKLFSTPFNFYFFAQEFQPITFCVIPILQSNLISSYYCDANAPPLFKLYNQYIFYDKF